MLTRATTSQPQGVFRRALALSLLGTLLIVVMAFSARPSGAASFSASNEAELVTAINAANAAGAGIHEVTISADITLTASLPIINNAAADSITIEGNDHKLTGDGSHTVLSIAQGTTAVITKLSITGGVGSSGMDGNGGGAIFNRGDLTVSDSTISGNSADKGGGILSEAAVGETTSTVVVTSAINNNTAGSGGAVANVSTGGETQFNMDQITLASNTASQHGGAILNLAETNGGAARMSVARAQIENNQGAMTGGGLANQATNSALAKLTVLRSTFSGNSTGGTGGGLAASSDSGGKSDIFISRATFSGNTAVTRGGGIDQNAINGSALIVASNLTVSGNTGGTSGGGIANESAAGNGRVQMTFATLAGNTAVAGNDLYTASSGGSSVINLGGSIVNGAGDDCAMPGGTIESSGFNVGSDTSCALTAPTDLTGVDPLLQPLALNAPGDTKTHALASGSPAVNRVTQAYLGCGTSTAVDQRGALRLQGIKCDSGAYELDRPSLECTEPYNAGTDAGLNKAILCVNAAGVGEHTINITGSFTLAGPSTAISNSEAIHIVVNGNGHEINGGGTGTVLSIADDTNVTITDLDVTNGLGSNGAGRDSGGGLYVRGNLQLENATVSNSTAVNGGGILVDGEAGEASAVLSEVLITGNQASRAGGGVATTGNTGQVTLTVDSSTIAENTSGDMGGGIDVGGYEGKSAVSVTNSTIEQNNAKIGGGFFVNGNGTAGIAELNLDSSTVSGNSASHTGGGIAVNGNIGLATANLLNTTVSGNSAAKFGGAIINTGNEGTAALVVHYTTFSGNTAPKGGILQNEVDATASFMASILAGPSGPALCEILGGAVSSGDYNVGRDNSCNVTQPNDVANVNANLQPLALNAPGSTETHALGSGSPALDLIPAGSVGCGSTVEADQRGVPRPQPANGRCDSGSYEHSQGSTPGESTVSVFAGDNQQKISPQCGLALLQSEKQSGWPKSGTGRQMDPQKGQCLQMTRGLSVPASSGSKPRSAAN